MNSTKVKKSQRAGVWNSSVEQKRARNRQSQRSFRERRMLRMQELESRVQSLSMADDERNARLVAENNAIRAAWVRARQKVAHLEMMLQSLKEILSADLGLPGDDWGAPAENEPQNETVETTEDLAIASVHSRQRDSTTQSQSPPSDCLYQYDSPSHQNDAEYDITVSASEEAYMNLEAGNIDPFEEVCLHAKSLGPDLPPPDGEKGYDDSLRMLQASLVSGNAFVQVPVGTGTSNVIGNEFQLLFPELTFPLYLSPQPVKPPEMQLGVHSVSCSSLSECLEAMESTLKAYVQLFGDQASDKFLDRACLLLMIFFSRYVWPGPPELFLGSFCYGMAERMILWRSSASNRSRIHLPLYLIPTEFQMSTRNPPMISWVSIAPLRDLILQHYSSDRDFDMIWLDCMSHAVVEIEDLSSILTGVGRGRGFLGVWNIFDIISSTKSQNRQGHQKSDTNENFPELSELDALGLLRVYRMPLPDTPEIAYSGVRQTGSWEPVSLQRLFSSPDLARKLYHHLELYDAHKTWRMDPAFFDKYPNLKWDGYERYTATGISLRMTPQSISILAKQSREQILYQYQQALFNMNDSMPL